MNNTDTYVYIIVALMPLAAVMLTLQVNPYNALVIRGILGGVAALVYAVLGAADVALTEALVGTMLAIMLYVVAVRSSLVMRLGVLKDSLAEESSPAEPPAPFSQLLADLRGIASKYHLRLELIPYADAQELHQALMDKTIHATCVERSPQEVIPEQPEQAASADAQPKSDNGLGASHHHALYHTTTRIRRLYNILQTELTSPTTSLAYVAAPESGEKH
jgi:putative multicomponent Na+:H+ antiporter subunit B